jgi:hypothetical protein
MLARRRGVQFAAEAVEDLGDLLRGVLVRSFEQQVLDEVRDAGALIALVTGAGADPVAERDGANLRQPFRDDPLARVELGDHVLLHGRIVLSPSTLLTATDVPHVGLRCYQGSNWVFDAYVGYYPSYLFDPWFTLDSNYWADGVAAISNARLVYFGRRGREIVLQTVTFAVDP